MKANRLFSILMVALSVTTISAQEKIVYGGFGLPKGNLDGDEISEAMIFDKIRSLIYLRNRDHREGGADLGFNVGFKMLQSISPELSWFISGDIFYNGLNSDIKDDWEDGLDDFFDDLSYEYSDEYDVETVSLPSYINIPIMGGVNYTITTSKDNISIFAEAGIGLNARLITDFCISGKEFPTGKKIEYIEEYDNSFTIAYQFGGGVKINDQFTIGMNYYGLGSDKINGKMKVEYGDYTDKDKFKTGKKLESSMFALRVGYIF